MFGLGEWWINDRPSVVVDSFAQDSYDPSPTQRRFFVQESDDLSAESKEMIAMQAQSLTGASEVQQMNQEDLEDVEHKFPWGKILGLDTPSPGPVIDVQELFFEGGGQGVGRSRRRWFTFPAHAVGLCDLAIAEMTLEVACKRIDPDAFDGLSVSVQGVELASALRIAEVLPVGGLVTGTGETRLLDEGFEQDRPIGVAGLPVIGQAA